MQVHLRSAVVCLAGICCFAGASCAAEGRRIPECGVASLYATMRLLGRQVELGDLEDAFRDQLRRDDLTTVSLAEIRQVAESYALHTAALRVAALDLRGVPLPAILYLKMRRPRQPPIDIGHFVVVRATDGEQVELIDLTSSHGWRWVSMSRLREVWRGELLAISGKPMPIGLPWSRYAAGSCFALALLAFGLRVYSAFRSRFTGETQNVSNVLRLSCKNRPLTVLIMALIMIDCGCLQGEPEPPLIVENPVVDLGLVRGSKGRVTQPFTLRVWDRGAVKTVRINAPCCGAGPLEPDLTGQELAAGSSHVVLLTMNRTSVGPWMVIADVLTDPPSPKPITMTLSAVMSGLPVVSPERLDVEQAPGEHASASFRISYMRTQEERPLELDIAASAFSPFSLQHIDTHTELVPDARGQPNPPQWDQLTLNLGFGSNFPCRRASL